MVPCPIIVYMQLRHLIAQRSDVIEMLHRLLAGERVSLKLKYSKIPGSKTEVARTTADLAIFTSGFFFGNVISRVRVS